MHIKMTSTQIGSVDGIRAAEYAEGREYDLTNTDGERELASAFVDAGMAVEVGSKSKPQESQDSPDNNAMEVPKRGRKDKAE